MIQDGELSACLDWSRAKRAQTSARRNKQVASHLQASACLTDTASIIVGRMTAEQSSHNTEVRCFSGWLARHEARDTDVRTLHRRLVYHSAFSGETWLTGGELMGCSRMAVLFASGARSFVSVDDTLLGPQAETLRDNRWRIKGTDTLLPHLRVMVDSCGSVWRYTRRPPKVRTLAILSARTAHHPEVRMRRICGRRNRELARRPSYRISSPILVSLYYLMDSRPDNRQRRRM